MKFIKLTIFLSVLLFSLHTIAESPKNSSLMTQAKMQKIIEEMGLELNVQNNVISFMMEKTQLYCVWDIKADRMRLVSPITEIKDLPAEFLTMAL